MANRNLLSDVMKQLNRYNSKPGATLRGLVNFLGKAVTLPVIGSLNGNDVSWQKKHWCGSETDN